MKDTRNYFAALIVVCFLVLSSTFAEEIVTWVSDSNKKFVGVVGGGFALCNQEVSTNEFREFVDATGYVTTSEMKHLTQFKMPAPKRQTWRLYQEDGLKPVVNVSVSDAIAYSRWLSDVEKNDYRLPNAAEWHQIATIINPTVPLTQSLVDANHGRAFLGVHHLLGNVREICDDFATPIQRPSDLISAKNDGSEILIAVRGGAWNSPAEVLKIDCKDYIGMDHFDNTTGFRLAVSRVIEKIAK